MPSFLPQTAQRQRFHQPADTPAHTAHLGVVLQLLLAQDGSTTRLCEAIAKGPLSLQVHEQRVVQSVPTEVRNALPGSEFMERTTSLAAHGQVMMDNLSYIALEGLPLDVRCDLEGGAIPIGHLLSKLWVRRSSLDAAPTLYERLWAVVGLPDPTTSRTYCIETPVGPRMVIAETYRRGMLIGREKTASP
jgi:chorismate-pyruvate lyase